MNNPLDLKRYTKDYISMGVFQLGMFCIIILTLWTMNAEGWNFTPVKTYSCPANQYNHSCIIKEGCEEYGEYSGIVNCTPTKTIIVNAGETTREKEQSQLAKDFGGITAIILLFSLIINHLIWLYRRNKI